jgi:hypothetical protein
MSYILDALKKSDKERQQGETQNLQTIHTSYPGLTGPRTRNAHRRWYLLVTILFFTGATAGIGYYRDQPSLTSNRDSLVPEVATNLTPANQPVTESPVK